MPILKKIFEIYVIFSAFFIYIFCKLYLFFYVLCSYKCINVYI